MTPSYLCILLRLLLLANRLARHLELFVSVVQLEALLTPFLIKGHQTL